MLAGILRLRLASLYERVDRHHTSSMRSSSFMTRPVAMTVMSVSSVAPSSARHATLLPRPNDWTSVNRPNVMIKVLADERHSGHRGANWRRHQRRLADVLDGALRGSRPLSRPAALRRSAKVASVASFFVSRVDTMVDRELERLTPEAKSLLGKIAIANSSRISTFREIFMARALSPCGNGRAGATAAVGEHRHQKPKLFRCTVC